MNNNIRRLKRILSGKTSLAIACSGGTDSTFLAKFAKTELPDLKIMLFHVVSPLVPAKESDFFIKWAKQNKIPIKILKLDPLAYPSVRKNSRERCYHCKKIIMKIMLKEAGKLGIKNVADGTNVDDFGDYRPGLKATKELKIMHPLSDAGFDKKMIRRLARKYGLPNWNTPSSACLASRIPYGTALDSKTLSMVEAAEDFLSRKGFLGCRVRVFGRNACIETGISDLKRTLLMRDEITGRLKKIGFSKILINLEGYSTGSLN